MSELGVFLTTQTHWGAFLYLSVFHHIETILFGCVLCLSRVVPRSSLRAADTNRGQASFWPAASCVLVGWLLQGHLQASWIPRWSQSLCYNIPGNNVSRFHLLSTHTDTQTYRPHTYWKKQEAPPTILNALHWSLTRLSPQRPWFFDLQRKYTESYLTHCEGWESNNSPLCFWVVTSGNCITLSVLSDIFITPYTYFFLNLSHVIYASLIPVSAWIFTGTQVWGSCQRSLTAQRLRWDSNTLLYLQQCSTHPITTGDKGWMTNARYVGAM